MKQLIVLLATLLLGLQLFSMIAGREESSILSTMGRVWIQEIDARKMEDIPEGGL